MLAGKRIENEGKLARQDDEQAFRLEHPHLAKGAARPLTVTPKLAETTHEAVTAAILARAGSKGVAPPAELVREIAMTVLNDYSGGPNKGNFPAAMQAALDRLDISVAGEDGWFSDDRRIVATPRTEAPAAPVAPVAPAATSNPVTDTLIPPLADAAATGAAPGAVAPAIPAAPVSPAATPLADTLARHAQEGATVRGPDGRIYVVRNGQLVPATPPPPTAAPGSVSVPMTSFGPSP